MSKTATERIECTWTRVESSRLPKIARGNKPQPEKTPGSTTKHMDRKLDFRPSGSPTFDPQEAQDRGEE